MVVVEVEVVNVVLEHPLVERLLSRRRLVADLIHSDGLYSANEQVQPKLEKPCSVEMLQQKCYMYPC